MIIKLAEGTLKTKYGTYQEHLYYDGQQETIALVMGDVKESQGVLCRVHSSCMAAHAFNSIECDCREQMAISQKLIQQAGQGIIIWMEQEGKGNGHYALMESKFHKAKGMKQADAYEAAGFQRDARDFRPAAEILQHLGVASIRMITNNVGKVETLARYGVEVAGTQRTL